MTTSSTPATIKLFLAHGSPTGLRTAELSNWSGKAIAAPRSELAAFLKRSEVTNPGIYFLTGVDPDSGERVVYVGEAENVAKRLRGHKEKDFWNAVTTFVSKDENLTKAHIRYLEGYFISLANDRSTSVVVNAANGGAKLPESDAAEMDVFIEKVEQLLPVLGVSDFVRIENARDSSEDLLSCTIKGLVARGNRTASGFVIYEGSQAVLEHRPSARRVKAKREELIESGVLVKVGEYLSFTRNFEFGSPSTAGGVVKGGNTNGLKAWKNRAGQTLREIEEE